MASSKDSNERLKKRTKFDYFDDVAILVGKAEMRFVAHKNIISRSSEFFRAAIEGEWKETRTKTVFLPETDPVVFGIYLGWLYSGTVDARRESTEEANGKGDAATVEAQRVLVEAYVLGDFLQDTAFSNAIVDEIKRIIADNIRLPGVGTLTYLWNRVTHGSTLAKIVVDYYATDLPPDTFDQRVTEYPPSFVGEIAKLCVRELDIAKVMKSPENRPKCYYHEHRDEKDKCE